MHNLAASLVARTVMLVILAALLLSCSSGGSSSPPVNLPTPLAERFVIDGNIDLSVFTTVHEEILDLKSVLGTGASSGTTTLRWAMANDERNLYVAMEWTDAVRNEFDPAVGLTDFDGAVILFDNDGNGTFDLNEDAHRVVTHLYGSAYNDIHNVSSGSDGDDIGDGLGKATWAAGKYSAEFLIPLVADANGQDGILNASTRFNINILDHIQIGSLSGNIASLSGPANLVVGMNSSAWPKLPYVTPATHDQPQIPSGLTGLIAFISDHENSSGELYTFDPATMVLTRVTNTTGLYMDGVSLSHDRSRIAFYGGPSSTSYADWEIYTVNTDGTGLTALTSNALLDGHPAWSPDDSKIVYASFRSGGQASLILMSSAGVEQSNLTPTGWNDNDPDWTPDGRIVFKTDRFGTPGSPQVRIAVMNADGSAVAQLTSVSGTSDHDPTATNSVAVFERFTKGTDYSTDPSAVYSAWDIIRTNLNGSSPSVLIADGWINWLPVHDPAGQYLVYLKSVGYTDARLMTSEGRDLGRLIPGITRIRHIDWK